MRTQLYDADGVSIYPKGNPDGNVYYEGEQISLSKNRSKVTSIGTYTKYTTSAGSIQGILYRDGELFQFYNGGVVDVYDVESFEYKRTFTITGASGLHFGGVDWLYEDSNVFVTHDYATKSLYIIDINDESDVQITSVSTPDIPDSVISSEGIVSVDRLNGQVYLTGYIKDEDNVRLGITIYKIDKTTGDSEHLTDSYHFFHLQDSKWNNGHILYCNDRIVDTPGTYDTLGMVVADPYRGVIANLTIPGITGKEAEGICVVDEDYILFTYIYSSGVVGVYKIELYSN